MRGVVGVMAVAMIVASCGGDGLSNPAGVDQNDQNDQQATGSDDGDESGGQSGDASSADEAPAPVGPAEMDTIRIGSEVWQRTLPMTSGQCFVFEDDGVLPSSAVAWGPLDGEEGLRFDASVKQDGAMEAAVNLEDSYWWRAGARSGGPDDLEILLDFDALTITGQGTFTDIYSGESAAGSFAFQCDDDGTGTG